MPGCMITWYRSDDVGCCTLHSAIWYTTAGRVGQSSHIWLVSHGMMNASFFMLIRDRRYNLSYLVIVYSPATERETNEITDNDSMWSSWSRSAVVECNSIKDNIIDCVEDGTKWTWLADRRWPRCAQPPLAGGVDILHVLLRSICVMMEAFCSLWDLRCSVLGCIRSGS